MAAPETCPNCGADLPTNAKVCPECGSDDQTGWSEQANTDGLDLPDENFDYGEFVKREFEESSHRPRGIHWFWWLFAIALALSIIFLFLR